MTDWQAKLAAWIHDPGDKPWVLLRDRAGHEGGTTKSLRSALFDPETLDALQKLIKTADHWAAAADRPQWPRKEAQRWGDQVRFDQNPVLVHPLSGDDIHIRKLTDTVIEEIKVDSYQLFNELIMRDENGIDHRRTSLAFWRFAPLRSPRQLGLFWRLAPADTRVPDHSIWQHVDLTSALTGAMAGDPQQTPALMTMSFGPVQGFIAQARTTSDLWAGSHLLSQIAWQGMKIICQKLGPDSIVFPQLRGLPEVDKWLEQEMDLPSHLFDELDYKKIKTDANPMFSAAVPNRFLAIVPASQAETLAQTVSAHVKQWLLESGRQMIERIADLTELSLDAETQLKTQLQDFPEVYWSTVSWGICDCKGDDYDPQLESLKNALATLSHPEAEHFLSSNAWQLLSKEISLEGETFWKPNPGALYPAVYELLDQTQGMAKNEKKFHQSAQQGFRCSLCGEREWLHDKREHLNASSGQRKSLTTIWNAVHRAKPSLAANDEHLCVVCAIKRLWPSMVLDEARKTVTDGKFSGRFVVSTHTLAMERDLSQLARMQLEEQSWQDVLASGERTALPLRLMRQLHQADETTQKIIQALPACLDNLNDNDDQPEKLEKLNKLIDRSTGSKPETYYGMLLFDGDNMGAWLSGDEDHSIAYKDSWHPVIRSKLSQQALQQYANTARPASPSRHMAISAALNSYALKLVRIVVEDIYGGKLIYAGGDDVFAMLPVADLFPAMVALRMAYSGMMPGDEMNRNENRYSLGYHDELWETADFQPLAKRLWFRNGYVYDQKHKHLYRVMGKQATASCGAVIVHHKAPLTRAIRQLRVQEKKAKTSGRDAFSIAVMKRSGGTTTFTSPWFQCDEKGEYKKLQDSPAGALLRMRGLIADGSLSRRAIYLVRDWLRQLPARSYLKEKQQYHSLLRKNIVYQFLQQSEGKKTDRDWLDKAARGLVDSAFETDDPSAYLDQILIAAEFLARGSRYNTGEADE